jgi:hypothetical protein
MVGGGAGGAPGSTVNPDARVALPKETVPLKVCADSA